MNRHFLGWGEPLCTTVPAWILEGKGAGMIDLRGTAIVVPTRQAGWRLRAALPLASHERGASLLGPEVVTAPGLLRPPDEPGVATPLQVLLAWCETLRVASPETTGAFLGSSQPDSIALALPLARRLESLRKELADGAQTIADVAEKGPEVCPEVERWEAMRELERGCIQQLSDWGMRDPVSVQLEYALSSPGQPPYQHVVMAAIPDPPQLLLKLLEGWASRGTVVDILVAAPTEEVNAFDAWGRPDVVGWGSKRQIMVEEEHVLLCVNPDDQAAQVARILKEGIDGAGKDQRSDQSPDVAIGVPDAETIGPLQRELAGIGFEAFDPRNRSLQESPLLALVKALLGWQRSGSAQDTATLLRHPDILAACGYANPILGELDTLFEKHLPVTFEDVCRHARQGEALCDSLSRLAGWRKLIIDGGLADGLRLTLQDIYGRRMLNAEHPRDMRFRESVSALDGVLRELSAAERAGQVGADGDAVFMARLQDASIKPERAGEPLDLEGWLELGWNPSPLMFVCGLNEGMVPDSKMADLFLPDSLRKQIGLRDDEQRMAREAYLLTSLVEQRKVSGHLVVLTGKTSLSGDPLKPSRLLFRCPDEQLIARCRKLFANPPPLHATAALDRSFLLKPFGVPDMEERFAKLLDKGISATKFRDYLTCPFRFYLTHVLKMQSIDEGLHEPGPGPFGDLVHDALEAMAKDADHVWACGDSIKLADWLEAELRRRAQVRFGDRPWLGVSAAVESAVGRVRAFAARQVEWHAQGWDIVESEKDDYTIQINGLAVTGRIDRIDRNRQDGMICVLDYKTTDSAKDPQKTHLAAKGKWDLLDAAFVDKTLVKKAKSDQRWIDLQLSLYRELVRATYGADVKIGYVLLPAAVAETKFAIWDDYTAALHESACSCVKAVVEAIRDFRFWPPAPGTVQYDDYGELLFDDAPQFVEAPGSVEEVSR